MGLWGLESLAPEALLLSHQAVPLGYRIAHDDGRTGEGKRVEFFTGSRYRAIGEPNEVMPKPVIRAVVPTGEILKRLPPGIQRELQRRLERAKDLCADLKERFLRPIIREPWVHSYFAADIEKAWNLAEIIDGFMERWEDEVVLHACKCGAFYDDARSWAEFYQASDITLRDLGKSVMYFVERFARGAGESAESTVDGSSEAPPDSRSGEQSTEASSVTGEAGTQRLRSARGGMAPVSPS